jgi:ABC-2 type transport system permease protein
MNELIHVLKREYLTRVRTKSFILITLLTPFLLLSIFLLPIYFATQHEDYKQLKIGLIDSSHSLNVAFDKSELIIERLEKQTKGDIQNLILTNKWEGIVYVSKFDSIGTFVQYYSSKQPSLFLLNQIKSAIQKVVVSEKLAVLNMENIEELIQSARNSVMIESIKVDDQNNETISSPYQRPLCMVLGVTIYIFIFLFAAQVMRSVAEEKTNRIVEIIITSVSPVKFMAGKIFGIALLGLTQIVSWFVIVHIFGLFLTDFSGIMPTDGFMNQRIGSDDMNAILNNLSLIDFNAIIPAFIFFFIGGYLLYSSIFAAISAMANHSDEIQQITMIVTTPLILAIIVLSNTVNTPDSPRSYWFSIIPFTSPVVMMGRIVYGVPIQDMLLSILLLFATVILIIWLSGKVYKTTILYTGKKIKIKDIRYKIFNQK